MHSINKIIISLSVLFAAAVPSFAQKTAEEAIKTSKTVVCDDFGNPTSLRLETFVTGDGQNNTIITTETKPLDVVFVLDVSGSMKDRVAAGSYVKFGNTNDKTWLQWRMWFTGVDKLYVLDNGVYREVVVKTILSVVYDIKYAGTNTSVPGNKDIYIDATKLETLKMACENFINTIEANATASKANHRIAVVTFASDAKVVKGLSTDYDKIKDDAISPLSASGATRADLGMKLVDGVFGSDLRNEKRTRIVVMFTDGAPTSSSNFEDQVANAAIKSAATTKSAGVKVYTVGIFDVKDNKIETFMSRLSSNYPDATSMTSKSQPGTLQTYYRKASSSTQLVDVFETIAHEATNNTSQADYFLETSSVTIQDVVSEYFRIPSGENHVRLSIVPIKENGVIGDGASRRYEWDYANADNDPTSVIVLPVDNASDGTSTVKVQGFDFNKNWVGVIETKKNGVVQSRESRGAKLVIDIDIEAKPGVDGGIVPTNVTENSGVYVGGNKLVTYNPDPATVLLPMVNLTIMKSGLKPGESILYHVTREGDSRFDLEIVLTADENGNAIGKARVNSKSGKNTFYTYKVTEDKDWAWAYTPVLTPVSKPLYTASKTLDNIFIFSTAVLNSKGTALAPTKVDGKDMNHYAEHSENNIFAE